LADEVAQRWRETGLDGLGDALRLLRELLARRKSASIIQGIAGCSESLPSSLACRGKGLICPDESASSSGGDGGSDGR
jgi:hypothetical protein